MCGVRGPKAEGPEHAVLTARGVDVRPDLEEHHQPGVGSFGFSTRVCPSSVSARSCQACTERTRNYWPHLVLNHCRAGSPARTHRRAGMRGPGMGAGMRGSGGGGRVARSGGGGWDAQQGPECAGRGCQYAQKDWDAQWGAGCSAGVEGVMHGPPGCRAQGAPASAHRLLTPCEHRRSPHPTALPPVSKPPRPPGCCWGPQALPLGKPADARPACPQVDASRSLPERRREPGGALRCSRTSPQQPSRPPHQITRAPQLSGNPAQGAADSQASLLCPLLPGRLGGTVSPT